MARTTDPVLYASANSRSAAKLPSGQRGGIANTADDRVVMGQHRLGTLPVPSTSFTSDPTFVHPGGEAELRYEFEREGLVIRAGLRFNEVRAFRFRSESHCTTWHVQDAYDTLVEVDPSDWAAELLSAEPSESWGHWQIRHFLIFLDGSGAYEVAAASWSWLAEEPAQ